MTDVNTVVDRYVAFWNESDAARRDALVADVFAPDAQYAGPLVEGAGLDGIAMLATRLKEHLSDFRFNRTSDVDAHHDVVRYGWELVPAGGGEVFAAGVDFCRVVDGKMQSVSAFLDVGPQGVGEH